MNAAHPNVSSPEPMIEVKNLHLAYEDKVIFDGIDFAIYPNEMVTLLGPSGTGKSTLLKILTGLIEPDQGDIQINSEKIGLAFQNGALFSSMTVGENIALPLERTTDLSAKEIEDRVNEVLALVGLEEEIDSYPNDLSGGMEKRVGIARAIAPRPGVMLYDEPTTGLDPLLADQLEQDLRKINQLYEMATIVVTHDIPALHILSDRVMIIDEGRFVYEGSREDFFTSDNTFAKQFRFRQEKMPVTP